MVQYIPVELCYFAYTKHKNKTKIQRRTLYKYCKRLVSSHTLFEM